MKDKIDVKLDEIIVTFKLDPVDYSETPRESIEKFMSQLKSAAVSNYMQWKKEVWDAFMSEYWQLHKYLASREKVLSKK